VIADALIAALVLVCAGAILMTVRRDDEMGAARLIVVALLLGIIVTATHMGART
jgi:hypothetical protein